MYIRTDWMLCHAHYAAYLRRVKAKGLPKIPVCVFSQGGVTTHGMCSYVNAKGEVCGAGTIVATFVSEFGASGAKIPKDFDGDRNCLPELT